MSRAGLVLLSDPLETLLEAQDFVAKLRSRLTTEKFVISEIGDSGDEVGVHQVEIIGR